MESLQDARMASAGKRHEQLLPEGIQEAKIGIRIWPRQVGMCQPPGQQS